MEALAELRRVAQALRENRALVDASSLARMSALRELVIIDCPKLQIETLLTASNL